MAYSPEALKSTRARPAASEIQPMGLVGRRDATRAPTSVKSRATARKMKGTFAVPQTPALSTTRVGPFRTRSTVDAESSATDIRPSDQASQEAARVLIPLTPRPCFLASSVTTPLYNTTISLSLTVIVKKPSGERASQNSPTRQSVNRAGGLFHELNASCTSDLVQ